MQWIRFLRDTDIFYGLCKEYLEALAGVCREVLFDEGEIIVRENDPSDEMYVIVQGTVRIVLDPSLVEMQGGKDRGSTSIVTLRPGQTFGEMGLVDRGLRSASARAAVPETRLLAFSRKDLVQLCESDFELGYQLMRNIASELAFKIRNTDLLLRAAAMESSSNHRLSVVS